MKDEGCDADVADFDSSPCHDLLEKATTTIGSIVIKKYTLKPKEIDLFNRKMELDTNLMNDVKR